MFVTLLKFLKELEYAVFHLSFLSSLFLFFLCRIISKNFQQLWAANPWCTHVAKTCDRTFVCSRGVVNCGIHSDYISEAIPMSTYNIHCGVKTKGWHQTSDLVQHFCFCTAVVTKVHVYHKYSTEWFAETITMTTILMLIIGTDMPAESDQSKMLNTHTVVFSQSTGSLMILLKF